MAEDPTTATPAGNTAEIITIVQEAVKKTLAESLGAAVAEAVKPITEQVAELKGELAKAATPDTVNKAVADAIAAQTASQAKATSRAEFIQKNLKDIPDAFHSMIGDDPSKWDEQAKSLRASLKSAGAKVGDDTTGSEDGRQAIIDKIIKEKLGGNANLGKLLTGATEQDLNEQADLIAAEAKKLRPDFGTEVDGGKTPNEQAGDGSGFLKMPVAATPAPAAATA